jgi:hypothetical protein
MTGGGESLLLMKRQQRLICNDTLIFQQSLIREIERRV